MVAHVRGTNVPLSTLFSWSKVDEANLVAFLIKHMFFLLISGIVALVWWVSNKWWFSHRLDDIWVGHFGNSQTTLTMLHNEECYPTSY